MLAVGFSILLLSSWHASSLPLPTQLSADDEKVTKCITEVLADTLSKPSPVPVTSDCLKILKEDERVLAMLHHHYLLKELKELVHEESAHRHPSHGSWQAAEEGPEEGEQRKWDKRLPQNEATSEIVEEEKEGAAQKEEYEKMEKIMEKVKEEKVSHGEDSTKVEEAKEILEGEEEEEKRKRGHEEVRRALPKGTRASKKTGWPAKRHFSEEASSEEEEHTYQHGGQHHAGLEAWEEEEEEEEKRSGLAKRMDEKASDEETAQFEAEEKGVKISDSQTHLHGDRKVWKEGKERHSHHHGPSSHELKKRHHEDEGHLKGKFHGHQQEDEEEEEEEEEEEKEEEEEREARKDKERELEKLEEIEHVLRKLAEKLRELRKG